jgi:N utilization substance protein B
MGIRKSARERVVQFLFQADLNSDQDIDQALMQFWKTQQRSSVESTQVKATWGEEIEIPPLSAEESAIQIFAKPLIKGTLENIEKIDHLIQQAMDNWDLKRLAVVDRNAIRLAVYEFLYREDIPWVVSINEAVDIVKKFSTDDSGRFVNGILDKIMNQEKATTAKPDAGNQPEKRLESISSKPADSLDENS